MLDKAEKEDTLAINLAYYVCLPINTFKTIIKKIAWGS